MTVAREPLAVAFDALRAAETAHETQHEPGALTYALAALERELRDVTHAFEVLHSARGHALDRLTAQVMTDATAGTADARLRLQGMSTGEDPARLALRTATHALELAEYVATIEGTEA